MTRKTFIKKMRDAGFKLVREGNSYLLKIDWDEKKEVVIFLKREKYTSSEDDFKKVHERNYADIRIWNKPFNVNTSVIGGNIDYLPFSLVEDYLDFVDRWHCRLNEIETIK